MHIGYWLVLAMRSCPIHAIRAYLAQFVDIGLAEIVSVAQAVCCAPTFGMFLLGMLRWVRRPGLCDVAVRLFHRGRLFEERRLLRPTNQPRARRNNTLTTRTQTGLGCTWARPPAV